MKIVEAKPEEAETVRIVMQSAFEEYKNDSPPSGAMEETTESIKIAVRNKEETVAVCYMNDNPAGIVRVKEDGAALYFFRLSVLPDKRGKGIGRALVRWVEDKAIMLGKPTVYCKVRASTPQNVKRYEEMGYTIFDRYTVEKPGKPAFKVISMKKQVGKAYCE
ncbi:GNAT superfamily N-acetyltransferase [Salibacterium salarium]|uniref:GNAT family N-acetyltransferase n=1 Tax=Salibacterium salarium TaxID=284579 RepID=UPI00277F73EB|nr:GNAT family N-acetyltransferase [Salibacterium salarium]MDQ0300007.1 GNAT superfamily N-acetyltransferase [Salibacterium salarium]